MEQRFDLVILGSGSTAFAAASRAAELGKTAVMTESRTLGGTCVNRGCLPSKNLIEAARIYWEAQHPRYPGLEPAKLGLDFKELVAGKDEVIRSYRDRKYRSIVEDSDKITVLQGGARFVDAHTVELDGRRLVGERILIATGARPSVPSVAGLDGVPYLTSDLLTSDEPIELFDQPRSLVVVGAGYVALELGQLFHRLGTKVEILQRSSRVLPDHEPEVSNALTEALEGEGIDIRTDAKIVNVEQERGEVVVHFEREGRRQAARGERLLVATGRAPNSDVIRIEKAGVALDERGFVKVDDELRTSVPHIWAAGDVIGANAGSQMATPVGAHDGVIAATNALGSERRKVNHDVIPRAVFTDPQVGVVGLTDEQANARGYRCACNTIPLHVVPRAGAVRDERGIVKMVLERDSEKVLGVSMVGRDAAEVIHEAAMAMRFGATVRDFIDTIHVYPTMAEALKMVALSFFKDVERMSCCAE